MTKRRELCDEIVVGKRLLTTDKGKMYNLYVLDGNTNTVEEVDDDELFDYWYDHCVLPEYFLTLVNKLDCEYTSQTFTFIKEEYETNYLR